VSRYLAGSRYAVPTNESYWVDLLGQSGGRPRPRLGVAALAEADQHICYKAVLVVTRTRLDQRRPGSPRRETARNRPAATSRQPAGTS